MIDMADHLKNPNRDPIEKSIALGKTSMDSLNGQLSKTAALAAYAAKRYKPPTVSSWRVEAITADGRRWTNGVRLATKEAANARFELEQAGYVTADVLQDDCPPNCSVVRKRKAGPARLILGDGDCVLLNWRPSELSTVAFAICNRDGSLAASRGSFARFVV